MNRHWFYCLLLTFSLLSLIPVLGNLKDVDKCLRSDCSNKLKIVNGSLNLSERIKVLESRLPSDEVPFVYSISNTAKLFVRSLYLLLLFAPILMTSWIAYFSSIFRTKIWFKLLSLAIASSGAAFIKWGQWASIRSDMFPEEFTQLLSELQSNAPYHSWSYTNHLVKDQLGESIEDLFDSFSRQPVSSGSVSLLLSCPPSLPFIITFTSVCCYP